MIKHMEIKLLDKKTNKIEKLLERTTNSYLVTRTKLTERGINCTHWFNEKNFKEQFEIIEDKPTEDEHN